MNLGEQIKYFRELNNLSQPELAKAIGVSNGTISFWENNINEPKASYVKKLAILFRITSDCLLGLENEFGGNISVHTTINGNRNTITNKIKK